LNPTHISNKILLTSFTSGWLVWQNPWLTFPASTPTNQRE